MPYYEVSALTCEGVDDMIQAVAEAGVPKKWSTLEILLVACGHVKQEVGGTESFFVEKPHTKLTFWSHHLHDVSSDIIFYLYAPAHNLWGFS